MKNKNFLKRLSFALHGLRLAFGGEKSLRTHAIFFLAALIALLILRPAPVWWALTGLVSGLVISAELFNTALERLADHVRPEVHDEIRAVKDIAAAAVLLVAITAIWIGAFLLLAWSRSPA